MKTVIYMKALCDDSYFDTRREPEYLGIKCILGDEADPNTKVLSVAEARALLPDLIAHGFLRGISDSEDIEILTSDEYEQEFGEGASEQRSS